jgi:hypothetical protein
MKKAISMLSVLFIFSACTKDVSDFSNAGNQSITGSTESSAITPAIKNGAMVGGNITDIGDKETVLDKLGVKYLRYTITVSDWNGSDGGFERFTRDGYKIVCNVNNARQDGTPNHFVTSIATYKNKLNSIFTKYKPEVAVIENEETNQGYYTGSMSQYINQLKAAVDVAHSKGVKVTDGGIHPQGVCYFVWKDYKNRGMNAQADQWMNLTFNDGMRYAALHPEDKNNSFQIYWRQIDTLLNAFTTMKLDYVNMHIYEPINNVGNGNTTIPGCIETMADYVKRRTGKVAITNECGQHNTNSTLVTSMLQAFKNGNYVFTIWYSADGTNSKALQNNNLTLRNNGFAYRNFVATH